MANNFAYLKKDHWAYPMFPDGRVPIVNILVPSRVQLQGDPETHVYMMDLDKITSEQLLAIVETIARGKATKEKVLAEIKAAGLPLRVSQCTGITTDSRAFL